MATIKANKNYNVENACKDLHKAMKGFGTDEKKLIEVLTSHNNAQRQEIKNKYKTMYGKELKEHIRSEVNGNFQDGLVGLLYTPAEFDARTLNKNLRLIGSRNFGIIEILASRSNAQLREIENIFKQKYGKDLDEELNSCAHLSLGQVFRALASATRPEDNNVNSTQATEDAKALYEAGEAQMGTNESEFIRVLCSRSFAQLRKTFDEYAKIAGKDITQSIKSEAIGDFEEALLAIVECVRDIPKYFAEQLYNSMHGIGTKDESLIRALISRSEIDLEVVKERYFQTYDHKLIDKIASETESQFEDLLKAIVKN